MAFTINDPQEIRLVEAWRKAKATNNRERNVRGGSGVNNRSGGCVPFFLLVQAVPIGRSYKVVCRLVEEPLPQTAVRDVDRYR